MQVEPNPTHVKMSTLCFVNNKELFQWHQYRPIYLQSIYTSQQQLGGIPPARDHTRLKIVDKLSAVISIHCAERRTLAQFIYQICS